MSGHGRRRAELGQHFLAGNRLAAGLVEQAEVGPDDLVVEIGAGTGVLTEALARRAGRVVAVERDPRAPLERADLVLQEQAARRYAAPRPGTPETIAWGAWYALATGRRLGPACFRPPPRVPVGGRRRFAALVGAGFRHPGLPLRRVLVPPLTYRQLRRLARDLDFPLDARPADLDAVQWAGLYAVVDSGRPGKTGGKPVG